MKYGRYNIVTELGKGAMGMVYRAHDPQIDRIIALKVLRPDRVTSDEFVQRFLKEARAIGRLSHPSIVTIYDVGQDQGTIYIAMEFLEGSPLNVIIQEKKLDPEEIVDIGVQIADALDYAHQQGIIHRDIKPANIIMTRTGQAKITDFGIARIEDPSATQQTQAGTILGTPSYMSPEQALGMPIDGRSDLYSLGVILYELTTGNRPFGGENLAATLRAIIQDPPVEPVKMEPTISPELSELIMKSLNKQPEDRFQTGQEIAKSLKACLWQTESKTVFEPPPQVAITSKKTKHRNLFVLIALIVIIIAGLSAYYLLKPPAQPPQQTAEIAVPEKTPVTPEKVEEKPPVKVAPPPVVETKPTVPEKTPVTPEKVEEKPPVKVAPPPVVETKPAVPEKTPVTPEKVEEKPPAKVAPPSVVKPEPIVQALLKVDSMPSGARVLFNGSSKGKTPLSLELPMGEYEIQVSLNDYHDWKARLQLDEEGEVPLFIRLFPLAERKP